MIIQMARSLELSFLHSNPRLKLCQLVDSSMVLAMTLALWFLTPLLDRCLLVIR